MLFDVRRKFFGVELPPRPPTGFGRQRALLGGRQIPVNGTAGQIKPPGGLGLGAAVLDELNHPLPQIQRIGFHALYPISLCLNVNVNRYNVPNTGRRF